MSNFQYIFREDSFINKKFDCSRLSQEILDSNIITGLYSVSQEVRGCVITFKQELTLDEKNILDSIISTHSGEEMNTPDVPRDISNKLRVHQTSRPLGLESFWTGSGDISSVPTDIGGDKKSAIILHHKIGDPILQTLYLDFNIMDNRTFMHEGLINWKDAKYDFLTMEMVSTPIQYEIASNTNYNIYNGVIVPAAGNGTINILSDLTTLHGGLTYIPDSDIGEPPTGFWDAQWDSENKRFINIRPNLEMKGRYHIFTEEKILSRPVNRIPLLGTGFQSLSSSDTDEIGNHMRLKFTIETNLDYYPDHDWGFCGIIFLHRAWSVF